MSFAREQASPRREPYRYLVRYCALWRRSRVTSPSLAAGRCTSVQRERAEPPAHTDPPREARSMHLSSRGNTNTRQDGAQDRIDDRIELIDTSREIAARFDALLYYLTRPAGPHLWPGLLFHCTCSGCILTCSYTEERDLRPPSVRVGMESRALSQLRSPRHLRPHPAKSLTSLTC